MQPVVESDENGVSLNGIIDSIYGNPQQVLKKLNLVIALLLVLNSFLLYVNQKNTALFYMHVTFLFVVVVLGIAVNVLMSGVARNEAEAKIAKEKATKSS
eukprot:Platyproteum_vivax@DN5746_c0_g1_i2.p1